MVKSFLHLENIHIDLSLHEVHSGNTVLSSSEEVLPVLHDFYSRLYEPTSNKTDEEIDQFLQLLNLPTVKGDTSNLIGDITPKEVELGIKKLRPGKAPRIDGLTVDFYTRFADTLSDILAKVFNRIFAEKQLTFSQRMAIIILLFKKGDHQLVENYRPISLTNTDYKILAYILTMRLEIHLVDIIHTNQTAYMPKSFIDINICSVQDFIDYIMEKDLHHAVLFLDFKKAFDSISHPFLFRLLYRIGLPEEFIVWIWIMHSNAYSVVYHRNWMTPHILLGRGV